MCPAWRGNTPRQTQPSGSAFPRERRRSAAEPAANDKVRTGRTPRPKAGTEPWPPRRGYTVRPRPPPYRPIPPSPKSTPRAQPTPGTARCATTGPMYRPHTPARRTCMNRRMRRPTTRPSGNATTTRLPHRKHTKSLQTAGFAARNTPKPTQLFWKESRILQSQPTRPKGRADAAECFKMSAEEGMCQRNPANEGVECSIYEEI